MKYFVYSFYATNVDAEIFIYWDYGGAPHVERVGEYAPEYENNIPEGKFIGPQWCDGQRLIQFKTLKTNPYAEVIYTEDAPECVLPVCNLKIKTPLNITKASGINSADGAITADFTGFGYEITWSLDNNNFQTSPTFTGLAPGAYTLYLKDNYPGKPESEQCRDQLNFVITYVVAYNPRFCLDFNDVLELNDYSLRINQKNYLGACEPVCGGASPFVVSRSEEEDKYAVIRPTRASITLIAREIWQFIQIFSSDERQHRVDFKENGALEWRGYMMPDVWSQPYQDQDFYVSMTATDGLATLKNYPYKDPNNNLYTGERRIIDIIFDCLDFLELDLEVETSIDLYELTMRETANVNDPDTLISDPLYQGFLPTDAFVEKGEPWDCAKVLTHCLNTFGGYITQSGGKWHISAIDVKRAPYWVTTYNPDRSFKGYHVFNPRQVRVYPNTGFPQWVAGVPDFGLKPAAKAVSVNADLLVKDNLIKGGDFTNDAFDNDQNLKYWHGAAPLERVVINDKQDKNQVRFTEAASSFATAAYQESDPVYLIDFDFAANGDLFRTDIFVSFDYILEQQDGDVTNTEIYFKLDGAGQTLTNSGWQPSDPTRKYTVKPNSGNGTQTFSTQTNFPETGNYRLRLYEVMVGSDANALNTTSLKFERVTLALLPNSSRPLEDQNSTIPNPERYTWHPEPKEVLFTDVPKNPNFRNIFRNYITIKGEQSLGWHYKGQTDNNNLLILLTAQIFANYSRPTHVLRGTLLGYFRAHHILQEPWDYNRLFVPNEINIDYRHAQISGTWFELIGPLDAPPGYILQETGAKILLETGGGARVE